MYRYIFLLSTLFIYVIQSFAQDVTAKLVYQNNDSTIVEDTNGYRYLVSHRDDGTPVLGVCSGGRYEGEVEIPSAVLYDGKRMTVTTVRKNAMRQKPGTPASKLLTRVSLPPTVTLVGTDAFRGNDKLRDVMYEYDSDIRFEARSMYECPILYLYDTNPGFAFTTPDDVPNAETIIISPNENDSVDEDRERYRWAFVGHRHQTVDFKGRNNCGPEAMECWCGRQKNIRGYIYHLRGGMNAAKNIFAGSDINEHYSRSLLLLTNNYVAKHHFPSFQQPEQSADMPAAFKQQMAQRFERKVKYSKLAAKLTGGEEGQIAVTEFEVKNNEGVVAVSWVVGGKEKATWVESTRVEPGATYSVWNVDDEGDWGVPVIKTIAKDEHGNVEIFMTHYAPESINNMHLVQKGVNLVVENENSWYNWIDSPE